MRIKKIFKLSPTLISANFEIEGIDMSGELPFYLIPLMSGVPTNTELSIPLHVVGTQFDVDFSRDFPFKCEIMAAVVINS